MDSKQLRELFPGASDEFIAKNVSNVTATTGAGAPKYLNRTTEYRGRFYDSAWEAQHARELDLLVKAGDIIGWVGQFPVPLRDGILMVVDFLVIQKDWMVRLEECKSEHTKTPAYRQKRKMFKALYPNVGFREIVKPDWR